MKQVRFANNRIFSGHDARSLNRHSLTMRHFLHRVVATILLVLVSAGVWAQWTDGNGVVFTVIDGSAGNNNEGPEKVCDGQTSTKFCADGLPCYVVVEASLPVKLTGYSLFTANDTQGYPDRNPRSWTIEGSMDGETWTTFVNETNNETMGATNYKEYSFDCSAPDYYKYIRLTVSKLRGGTLFQFSEFHPKGSVNTNGYVFISNETNGYFLNSSAQADLTFNENTCVWKAGATLKNNASTTLGIGTTYLRGRASDNANTAQAGTSTDYTVRWRSIGGYLVHRYDNDRYVYRNASNQAAWNNNTNIPTNAFRVYTCTKIAGGIDGSISGADNISTTGTSENYSGAATYTAQYYLFGGPDIRYYATGYTGATTTKPSGVTTGITYSNWTLEGADGYATVNSTTGVVTYNNLVPEGSRTVTLKCTATHTSSGKSVVLTKDITLINENIPTLVYLDPSVQYGGNDSNPGTKAKPVKTWKKAYSLLNKKGTVYNNYIILMSEYYYNINSDLGLATFQSGTGDNTYEKWKTRVDNVGMNVPATITSYLHDNNGNAVSGEIDYSDSSTKGTKSARYRFDQSEKYIFICADTRFEWMSFYGYAASYEIFFAQYFNVEFGHGLKMSHFKNGETYGVLCKDSYAADFQIFGGMNNDTRFKSDPRGFEEHLPHAKDGFKMIFRSGHFSNVCAGGRQADNNTNGVFGTPRQPIKAQIIVDIDRTWNDTYKQCITSAQGTANSNRSANYDIGMLLAGNHEGCMYGDVDLIVLSGYVARVVNGILGARRAIACTVGTGNYPYNAYMGRANALMDPSKMVDVHGNIVPRTTSYSDESAYITELYGGGLGRPLQSNGLLNLPVYGKNTVTINGGTIGIVPAEIASNTGGGLNTVTPAVFGGASGGVNGIGDDASRTQKLASDLTNEERLPYWMVSKEDGSVAYSDYNTWKTKNKVQVHCYNVATNDYTDIDLQYASTQVTINGGTFGTATRPIDGIYGGGSGYINGYIYPAATDQSYPFSDAGTLYGKPGEVASNLTINGGTFYCNIYGAGRGTDEYYSKQMYDANKCSRYTALAKVYGDVQVNINGGTIYGNVYGGGAGFAELKLYNKTTYGQMTDMARLTGNSTVNIGGNATITSFTYNGNTIGGNVYGGGMLAGVTGASTVNVAGTATVTGDVYAAAQGIPAVRSNNPQTMPGTNKTYILNTAANNILFGIVSGNTTANINGGSVGGNIFGGAEAARCGINTSNTATVNIKSAVAPLNDVYGGGELGDVQGNTAVNLLGATVHDVYGGGLGSSSVAALVQGNATVTLNGSAVTGNIFGANNLNGTPKGHVLVDVKATKTKGTEGEVYHVASVYGGGNLAAYEPGSNTDYAEVLIEGCESSIEDVFGGGNAAAVPATHIEVRGGLIDRLFAGGDGESGTAAHVGYKNDGSTTYGTGNTYAKIMGGEIHQLFGGSNSKGNIRGAITLDVDKDDYCDVFRLGEIYGGGNKADSKVGTINIGCTGTYTPASEGVEENGYIRTVFGGANAANITGNIALNIRGGKIGTVYGGNNASGTISGSVTVNIDKKNADGTTLNDCGVFDIGTVYGGGKKADMAQAANVVTVNINDNGTNDNKTIGSVYGGGEEASVYSTTVNLRGGTITGNVFGGGKGTAEAPNKVMIINGGTHVNAYGGSVANIFGGNDAGGTITGNLNVKIDKTHTGDATGYTYKNLTITEDVYGGGNQASSAAGSIDVVCANGIRNIFGGAKNANVSGNITLLVGSGQIQNIYGGNNLGGTAGGNITVNVTKVDGDCGNNFTVGNVFGGGYGKDTKTGGNVTVNIGMSTGATAGDVTISGDVYGGSALGAVNAVATSTTTYATTVNLYGGTIKGNVYGGGLGQLASAATATEPAKEKISAVVYGSTAVNVYAGTTFVPEKDSDGKYTYNTGMVFGCNNMAGAPAGSATVTVNGTSSLLSVYGGGNQAEYTGNPTVDIFDGAIAGNVFGGGLGKTAVVVGNPTVNIGDWINAHSVTIGGDVFGGGDLAAVEGNCTVTIRDCDTQIGGSLYGGGNAAPVYSTNTTMWGGTVMGNVFGGGNGADATKNAKGAQVGYKRDDSTMATGTDAGNAVTNVFGGTIGTWTGTSPNVTCADNTGGIYGGSNTNGNIAGDVKLTLDQRARLAADENTDKFGTPPATACDLQLKECYGAGNEAAYNGGDITFNLGCVSAFTEIYGGAKKADLNSDVHLIVSSGTFNKVFAGNNLGGCLNGSVKVSIDETGCYPVIIGELYGGGNQAAYSVYGYDTDGKPKTTGEKLYDDPEVNVISCTSIDQVFGGGYGSTAVMVGNPVVNINMIPGIFDPDTHVEGTTEKPNTKLGTIGEVFGGGNAAKVVGNTTVNVGTKTKNKHISGEDQTSEYDVGANISGNIYGGGNQADVTGKTRVQIGPAE